jgi:hypothetical protein
MIGEELPVSGESESIAWLAGGFGLEAARRNWWDGAERCGISPMAEGANRLGIPSRVG